jgi:hypothetical protein
LIHFYKRKMVWRNTSILVVVLYCTYGASALDILGSRHAAKADTGALSDDQGSERLIFTGPGYTINLIPQALLLGLLAAIAAFFLGADLFGTSSSGYGAPSGGYGAPSVGYGAPEPSYGAPASSGYDAPQAGYSAAGRQFDVYSEPSKDSSF